MSRPARSHAPITPRILLIGPYGSGRRTQAKALANKYDIINGSLSHYLLLYLDIIRLLNIIYFKPKVSLPLLIKEAVANETVLGLSMKSFLEKKLNGKLANLLR